MSNEFQTSPKSSWFTIGSSVLPKLSGGNGESSVIKSTRGLPGSFKRAEKNHTKIPTCRSDCSELEAASTKESGRYKVSVRTFAAILTSQGLELHSTLFQVPSQLPKSSSPVSWAMMHVYVRIPVRDPTVWSGSFESLKVS